MIKKIINGRCYYFHLNIMEVLELERTLDISNCIKKATEENNARDMIAIANMIFTKSVCQIIDGHIVKNREFVSKFAISGDLQTLIKEFALKNDMGEFFSGILDTTNMDDIIAEAKTQDEKNYSEPINCQCHPKNPEKKKEAPFSFKYYDNYVLMFEEDEKDTIYFAYIDNNDKDVSSAWKSKKDVNMTVTEVYYHDNYPLNIIEGHISKDKLKAFTTYMKELNEALSYMYDERTYEESKMFVKAQVYAGYYDRLRDEGYMDENKNSK